MANVRGFGYDDETGEVVFYRVNDETGEPLFENTQPPAALSPRNVITPTQPKKKYSKFPKGIATKSKKFQSLKANIIAGSNPTSHRMLLIPTLLMIFPGFISICLSLLEVFLHVRCHKKNKLLKDPTMFYRSPFHAVTSTFCGVCRESELAAKVGQLQDQRRYRSRRFNYIRGLNC